MLCAVVTLPDLRDASSRHWISRWESAHPAFMRIQHYDWNSPRCKDWVIDLTWSIGASRADPILVAHGLSCALVAHWARSGSPFRIAGAFLVAPSDTQAPGYPREATGFAPIPMEKLPFPSMVVASANDKYVSIERARAFAQAWGSKLVEIGNAGHIDEASGHGAWPEGERMLQAFCDQIRGGR